MVEEISKVMATWKVNFQSGRENRSEVGSVEAARGQLQAEDRWLAGGGGCGGWLVGELAGYPGKTLLVYLRSHRRESQSRA